jgi:hypothetical protein
LFFSGTGELDLRAAVRKCSFVERSLLSAALPPRWLVGGLLLTLCLVVAPSASALTIGNFKTPSGNIVCAYVVGPNPSFGPGFKASVFCGIKSGLNPPSPRKTCRDGDRVSDRIYLAETGRPGVSSCAGDPGPFVGQESARVLGYGKSWYDRRSGLRCTSAMTGLTCRNRSGHGFFLSRQRSRVF